MELFNNPILLFVAIVFSVVGSWLLWVGLREKHYPKLLYGIGLNIPTLGMMDWRFWLVGGLFGLAGLWIRNYLE